MLRVDNCAGYGVNALHQILHQIHLSGKLLINVSSHGSSVTLIETARQQPCPFSVPQVRLATLYEGIYDNQSDMDNEFRHSCHS